MTSEERRQVAADRHEIASRLQDSEAKRRTLEANERRLSGEAERLTGEIERQKESNSRFSSLKLFISNAISVLVTAIATYYLTPEIAALQPGPNASAQLGGVFNPGDGCTLYTFNLSSENNEPVDKASTTISVPGYISDFEVESPERERQGARAAGLTRADANGDCKVTHLVGRPDSTISVHQNGESQLTVTASGQVPSLAVTGFISVSSRRKTTNLPYNKPTLEGQYSYTTKQGMSVSKLLKTTVDPTGR